MHPAQANKGETMRPGKQVRPRRVSAALVAVCAGMYSNAGQAITFTLPWSDEETIEGVLNTTITAGAQ